MSRLLMEHGTTISRLKPNNIVQAAEADLKLMQRKREGEAPPSLRYSFANRHVRRAKSVTHLIALAYFDTVVTNKFSTLIIYNDVELLREALINELTETGRVEG